MINVDFPEPLTPVITTKHSKGIVTFIFFKLFSDAFFKKIDLEKLLGLEIKSLLILKITSAVGPLVFLEINFVGPE